MEQPPVRLPDAAATAAPPVVVPYASKAPHCARSTDPGTGAANNDASATSLDAASDADADGPIGNDASAMGLPEPAIDAGVEAAVPDVTALPQVMKFAGPVLTQPTYVPVTYEGDELRDEIEDAIASIGCTDYWRAATSEYGIGDAISGPAVHLSGPAPSAVYDSDIAALLAQALESGDPRFPPPAEGTVYVFFYPEGTTVSTSEGSSCAELGGYHSELQLSDGTHVVYAVVARCPQKAGVYGVTDTALLRSMPVTALLSHEMIEAATDPWYRTGTAYAWADPNHLAWTHDPVSELVDMCEYEANQWFLPQGFPWFVERSWSNRAAALKQEPCVPPATTHYVYAAPVMRDHFQTSLLGASVAAATVHIPAGSSATIDVAIEGEIGTGPIGVEAHDGSWWSGGTQRLTLTLDRDLAMPGDTLHLTIQKMSADPATNDVDYFVLSTFVGNRYTNFWGMTDD